MNALVQVADLVKTYQTQEVTYQALRGVTLEIAAGDYCAIMGPSGSGKSTLLHLVGGLDQPSAGTVTVAGNALQELDQTALARYRRSHIGFVFQFFNLIDNLTVQANVELPALLERGRERRAIRAHADELLDRLGIADQAQKHPWELSGGQQQRVAIARALINDPALLLADEPTGNLDSKSGQEVLGILDECNKQGQTILMVTHDAFAAARAKQVILLRDGQLAGRLVGGDAREIGDRLAEWTDS